MNYKRKNIILLSTIVMLALICACKKENVNTTSQPPPVIDSIPFDFRDSLVGTYRCTEYYSYTTVDSMHTVPYQRDSILGNVDIAVSKLSGDKRLLKVNGSLYTFLDSSSAYHFTTYGYQVMYDGVTFSNGTIRFSNTINREGMIFQSYDYYTGYRE